jgi:hypothetical protein
MWGRQENEYRILGGGKKLKQRDHLEDLGVNGDNDKNKSQRNSKGCKNVAWIHGAQERDQWRALENTFTALSIKYSNSKFSHNTTNLL